MICTHRVQQMEATFWSNLFSKSLLLNNWLLHLLHLHYQQYSYYTIIFTYRVRQMEAFWHNLFSQSQLLNNCLLLVTTIGYYFYYSYKLLILLIHIWLLQMFTLAGYNWLLEYDLHIQGLANGSHFLAHPIQLELSSK